MNELENELQKVVDEKAARMQLDDTPKWIVDFDEMLRICRTRGVKSAKFQIPCESTTDTGIYHELLEFEAEFHSVDLTQLEKGTVRFYDKEGNYIKGKIFDY